MFSNFLSTGPYSPRCCRSSSLAGGIAIFSLPIAQYPEITPPTVEVSAVYPGAMRRWWPTR